MTEHTKKWWKNVLFMGIGTLISSLLLWIFMSIVSYSYGIGGIMSVPKKVNEVSIRVEKCTKRQDSIDKVFSIHEAKQTEQNQSISDKFDIIINLLKNKK